MDEFKRLQKYLLSCITAYGWEVSRDKIDERYIFINIPNEAQTRITIWAQKYPQEYARVEIWENISNERVFCGHIESLEDFGHVLRMTVVDYEKRN
jgi:hypothetical protein